MIQWKKLITAVSIPLIVGALSAFITKDSMANFALLIKPPLSPPGWLFPVVWTILYTLMGIASYLVLVSDTSSPESISNALKPYVIQLIFNFFWSIIFFNMEAYLFAFIWLCLLLYFILLTAFRFFQINKAAGYLMIPYILWVIFAGYLNLSIYLLN